MKIILLFCFISIVAPVFADTVLIRKSDGFPIEYQSGDVPEDILLKNNPLYMKEDVEIKKVTLEEYKIIHDEKIKKPAEEKNKNKKEASKNKIKQKLNSSDEDLNDLKEALQ